MKSLYFGTFQNKLFSTNTKASLLITLALKALSHRFFFVSTLNMESNFVSKFRVNTTPGNRVIEPQTPVENTSNFNYILKRIESNFFSQSINRDLHKLNNKSTLLLFIHQLKKGKD